MLAKYRGPCGICPEWIRPGDSIACLGEDASGNWVHAGCHPDIGVVAAALAESGPEPKATQPRIHRQGKNRRDAMSIPRGAVAVYTDGACSGNPGPGGWAWAVDPGRHSSGSEPATTNQRMEIRAALEAVTALPGPLVVVSDSTYVVDCFRDGWWRGWRSRGWTNSAKKPVANRDLWEPLIDAVEARGDVAFRWVKGHSGDPMNDLADHLAVMASHQER